MNEAADDVQLLTDAIQKTWPQAPSGKATGYVGQFVKRKRAGTKISGRVEGNHGMYTVSARMQGGSLRTACSCYVGKNEGFCHHCVALGFTFLNDPASFEEVQVKERVKIKSLEDLPAYLNSVTLDDLVKQLKAQGVTQQALAAALRMSSQHLSAVKSSGAKKPLLQRTRRDQTGLPVGSGKRQANRQEDEGVSFETSRSR